MPPKEFISSASAEKGSIGPLATSKSSDPDALDGHRRW